MTKAGSGHKDGSGFYSIQRMEVNAIVSAVLGPVLMMIALVRFGLLIRLMPLEAYGVFILLSSIIGQFDFLDGGLRQSLQRYIPQFLAQDRHVDVGRAVTATLLVMLAAGAVIAAGLTVFVATGGISVFGEQAAGSKVGFYVAAAALVLLWPLSSFEAAMEGINRFNEAQILRLVAEITRTALVVWAATEEWQVEFLFVIFLAPMVIVQMSLAVRLRYILGTRVLILDSGSLNTVREIFHYSRWVALGQIGGAINGSLDKIVVGAALGVAALPIYHGLRQVLRGLSGLSVLLSRIVLPAISYRFVDKGVEATHGILLAGTRVQMAFLAPFVTLIVLFAEPILTLWAGEKFGTYARTLQIGAVLFLLVISMKVLGRVAAALETEIRYLMLYGLGVSALSTALIYGLGIAYGVSGAFLAVVIAPLIPCIHWHVHLLQRMKVDLWKYATVAVLPGLMPAMLVMVVGLWLTPEITTWRSHWALISVGSGVVLVVFGASYRFGLDGRSRGRLRGVAVRVMRLNVAKADVSRQ
jgi:O-antigen/teichoic acid export membrane protein